MNLRDFLLENFVGDLEYHPRRAAIYLLLAAGAGGFWFYTPADRKFTVVPLVFILGSLTLLVKGIFLLRASSEGIGLSDSELAEVAASGRRKRLPSLLAQAAQSIQDFGTGGLLLWPLLNLGKDIDQTWNDPPRLLVFLAGAFLFTLGLAVRRFTEQASASTDETGS